MNFNEAVDFLIVRQGLVKKGGLKSVGECLEHLGNPQKKLKTIHVTGTNGKGSVCALFAAACKNSGLKTGLFISPHLESITERLQIDGKEISKERFASLLTDVYKAGPDLSFFEMITCMAFLYFCEENVDIAVIEVGIGGRLDSTNIIEKPLLSIITSVSFDHKQYLGNTLREIAFQKAGIIKHGGICIAPLLNEEARTEILKEAQSQGAQTHFFAPVFEIVKRDIFNGFIYLRHKKTDEIFPYAIQGDAQVSNATLLWEGIELLQGCGLSVNRSNTEYAFKNVSWPGRFQVIKSGAEFNECIFVVDGAHNPEAAECFSKTWISSGFNKKMAAFVVAVLNDKERNYILGKIAAFDGVYIFTKSKSSRSVPPSVLAEEFKKIKPNADVEIFDSPQQALKYASKYKIAAVVGSLYLAGEALKLLKKNITANV